MIRVVLVADTCDIPMTVSDHSHRFVSFISPESPAPALHMINIPTAQEKAEKAGVTPINTKPSPATCSAWISAAFVSCFCSPSDEEMLLVLAWSHCVMGLG